MYVRIFEPGKYLVNYGEKLSEIYFITQGSVVFYDQKGVTPFLQLPKYSFFGDYQILFDLRANYSIKVTGKEEYGPDTVFSKQEKTFCLCVNKDIF